MGCPIVTNGEFAVQLSSKLQFEVVCGVGRGIGILDGDPRRARGRGVFLGGSCSRFSLLDFPLVANGEMF